MLHARKIFAILLALVMVFAMSATAFAAEGSSTGQKGTITVENPITGQTYTAYKIFDVTYNGEAYAYTIDANSQWYSVVAAFAAQDNSGLTLTQAVNESGGIIFVATIDGNFRAAAFAAALKAGVDGKTGTPLSGTTPTVTGLDLGYYFVTSSSGALCNLTTTNPTANIYDKNDVPFEKVDDAEDVEVGQTVNYTITGKVPDTTGFTSYTYKIEDTMSDGLTFNKDVSVSVGGVTLTDKHEVKYTDNGFTLTIDVMNLNDQVNKEIKVTYSAVVNSNAIAQTEKNSATLTYSNDPTNEESGKTTPPDEETVYSAQIVINKINEAKENLANARFVLYKEVTEGETTTKHYYFYNATDDKVQWIPLADSELEAALTAKTISEVVTDSNGAASFGGLADGTYHLVETAAPDGYNPLTEPVSVTINNGDAETINLSITTDVVNKTGSVLPETGGMGTTLFYGFGCIMVLCAVVLLVSRKRIGYTD